MRSPLDSASILHLRGISAMHARISATVILLHSSWSTLSSTTPVHVLRRRVRAAFLPLVQVEMRDLSFIWTVSDRV
jgi:hypothetical protein